MDTAELKNNILEAVSDYVSATEAWDDAVLAVDTAAGTASLMEEEESEHLPNTVDVYDIMDFVEMDSAGTWVPDEDSIASVADGYAV